MHTRRVRRTLVTLALVMCARRAAAEPAAPRPGLFAGPFTSSHLFAMPTADVVGPYQLSLAGEASLLSETDALSSGGLAAVGFGDIAQLEYRVAAAFSNLGERDLTLPSLGVQFKAPLRERRYLPAFAMALRLGLPRKDELDDGSEIYSFDQRVNDLYLVSRLRLWGPFERFTLHGGLRVGAATIIAQDGSEVSDVLWLPAGGWEVQMTPDARLVGELALVPAFHPTAPDEEDRIATKPFGRLGVRWAVHPAVVVDASLGYRIEVARFMEESGGALDALVDWDIRLGAELFVPWGALACRTGGVLCQSK